MHIQCALRFGWTEQQVDALSIEYVDELRAAMAALDEYQEKQQRRAKTTRPGFTVEDVDLSEIT